MIFVLAGLGRSSRNVMGPNGGSKGNKTLFLIFILVCIGIPLFLVEEKLGIFHHEPVHLVFVGDIMLSRQIGNIIENRGATFPFEKLGDSISKADIAFANLENPVSTLGSDQGSIYSFRAKPETLQGLKYAGFDVVSIANNHMFDWGTDAFVDTMTHLRSYGIDYVGGGLNQEQAQTSAKFKVNGEKFCFFGFTEFAPRAPKEENPGMAHLDQERANGLIKKAKEKEGCDAVVASIHWGDEYETVSNDYQKAIARSFVDAGALLVIGHHPHVIQEIEEYNGGLIVYSLGNFVFDQNFSEDTKKSVILNVSVGQGHIVSFSLLPIRFTKEFQPYIWERI